MHSGIVITVLKKAQVSMEYVVIVGVILVALIPLFFYSISKINSQIKVDQADAAVVNLANAVDSVHSLGPGSRKFIQVTIPSGVVSATASGKIVQLKVNIYGSTSDFYANTITNITGSLPNQSGTYTLLVDSLEDGTVRIGGYNDTSAPTVTSTSPSGTLFLQDITLTADTNEESHCRYDTTSIAYTSMSYDFTGELFTHEAYKGSLPAGNYTYYARCKDTSGNIMQSSSTITFSITSNGSSNIKPTINLEGPPDNAARNYNLTQFTYNASSVVSDIASCTFRMTGVQSGGGSYQQSIVDSSVIESTPMALSVYLPVGNFSWWVNCTDSSAAQNINMSEVRTLKVSAITGIVSSCAEYCANSGLNNGTCADNIIDCNNNCGLAYSQSDDCYAGTSASLSYCTGGPSVDTCCCLV